MVQAENSFSPSISPALVTPTPRIINAHSKGKLMSAQEQRRQQLETEEHILY